MTPPQKLRAELERHRDRGLTFRQAWPAAVSRALDGLAASETIFWRRTFFSQKGVWATSYSRLPWPANQRPGLTVIEREHAERATSVLVA